MKKAASKPGICRNAAKTADKTEKNAVLSGEMQPDSAQDSPKETPKKRGNPQNLVRYEKGDPNARINGKKGGTRKGLNAQVLNETAAVVSKDGRIPDLVDSAIRIAKSDPDFAQSLLAVAEKAMKLVGATHDQSPEARQNVNVTADVKKAETVKLVIEDFTKPEEGSEGSGV